MKPGHQEGEGEYSTGMGMEVSHFIVLNASWCLRGLINSYRMS